MIIILTSTHFYFKSYRLGNIPDKFRFFFLNDDCKVEKEIVFDFNNSLVTYRNLHCLLVKIMHFLILFTYPAKV